MRRRRVPPGGAVGTALRYTTAGTEYVDCGSAAVLDDIAAGTVLAWINWSTNTANQRIAVKSTASYMLSIVNTGLSLQFFIGKSTQSLLAQALFTNLSAWPGAGRWALVAATWNDAGVATDQRLYAGSLTQPATEASAYSTQRPGTGTRTSDAAANLLWGSTGAGAGFSGDIACTALFARVLSLAEIRQWQATSLAEEGPALMGGCVGLWYHGEDGAANVLDWSGYANTGTVTGASRVIGPPLVRAA